jgi:hypothetical protein
MEQKYDNTNRGSIWDNRSKKREGKKDPDFSGVLNVGGQDHNISLWINERSGDNQPAYSVSVRTKAQEDKIPF